MRKLVADLRHATAAWDASPAAVIARALIRAPLYPRLRAAIWFRLSSWCWDHRLRPLALWLQNRTIRFSGAELHPAADIGPGLLLVHTVGIVFGHEVVAGENLVVYQGVTLGHTGRGEGQPKIGDGVRIGAGAKVLGPVVIGDGAWIGANAVVLGDVPAGATVAGVWRGEPG
jgi:serine O-acetyltransferase